MASHQQGNGSWQSAVSGTSPKLANAMEAAMAAGAEVGRVGRRIFQRIWDPAPVNDKLSDEPVWCLGRSYTLGAKASGTPSPFVASTPPADHNTVEGVTAATAAAPEPGATSTHHAPDTPPDSIASSFDSSLAYEEDPGPDSGWPPGFLDDFESRIWMTYRTGFDVIPRSTDPKANSALSFTMRLKTSFGEQTGFSSDTGWGCMIRSGQSLLANALLVSRHGRGMCSVLTKICGSKTDSRARRLATNYRPRRRTRRAVTVRRRPPRSLLVTQLRQTWCGCVWEIPGGVVWAISDSTMHSVSHTRACG